MFNSFSQKSSIADIWLGSKYTFVTDALLISQFQAFENIFHLYFVTSSSTQYVLLFL